MGFMDKAKKLAEQAQQKIDETQKQFNEKQAQPQAPGAGAGVRYDEHGRPLPGEATSAADPAVARGVSQPQPSEAVEPPPAAPPQEGPPEGEERPAPPPPPPSGGANANPDPFKPIE